MTPIYLDYNATTPIDPGVVQAMLPYLQTHFGNPSSAHALGNAARDAVEDARRQVAVLLGARPDDIVFTGSGTEASNHAIKGAVLAKLSGFFGRWVRGAHVVISAVEHPATSQPCEFLKRLGCRITVVPVDRQGLVDAEAVGKALERGTTLVSIMHANNEVGTIQPIKEIAAMTKKRGILLHTDAAQSLGKIPVNVIDLGVDFLTLAGHKLYAPKGIGALYIRQGLKLEPLIHGAGHESGRRAGTENVPYIVGLGKACKLARQALPEAERRQRFLRDRLWEKLRAGLGNRLLLNGHPTRRLPNTLNATFAGHVGSKLLAKVTEIAASTGSACHEGKEAQSPVLAAMGISAELSKGAIRMSVGRFTSDEEVDFAATVLVRAAK